MHCTRLLLLALHRRAMRSGQAAGQKARNDAIEKMKFEIIQ
jgi:hypothetical protein